MAKKKKSVEQETNLLTLRNIKSFYDKNYKLLLMIPFLLALLSLVSISVLYSQTGDFFIKDISLKGGSSISIKPEAQIDLVELETFLIEEYPSEEFLIRALEFRGALSGFVIDTTLPVRDSIAIVPKLESRFDTNIVLESSTDVGSVLGESFFMELILTLALAFILMGGVVFLYFRNFVPSITAITCVIFDMIITLGVLNVLNIQISSAGVAAFLMLIGYSIDTDILLTTKVLKRIPGTKITDSIFVAMKTGLTMSAAGITATSLALIFSNSVVIKQIMVILVIGLIVDLLTTWLQNAGLLKWYYERKMKNE